MSTTIWIIGFIALFNITIFGCCCIYEKVYEKVYKLKTEITILKKEKDEYYNCLKEINNIIGEDNA